MYDSLSLPVGDVGSEPVLEALLLTELHLNEEKGGRLHNQLSDAVWEQKME